MAKNYSIRYKKISGPLPKEVIKDATDYALYEGNRRMNKAAKYLLREVIKASSVSTFTLSQLANKDHPYARRHGSIKNIGSLKPYNVHKRGGDFIKGYKLTKKPVTRTNKGFARVNYDKRHAKRKDYNYGEAIFTGTKRMLPRNPITGVFNEPSFQKNYLTILEGTRAASRGFRI